MPRIRYGLTSRISELALEESITLKQAASRLGHVEPEDPDRRIVPADNTAPGARLPGGGA
jgi:fumarate hydratase class II